MPNSLREGLPDALRDVRTTPLFIMRLDVRPLQVIGATPGAYRRVGVVPGGAGMDEPPADGGGRNRETDFQGEKRSNDSHASTTDPEARLYRKGPGRPAQVRAAVAALGRRDGGVRGGIRREEFPRKGRRLRGRPASLPLDVRQPIRIDRSRWRRGRTRACAPIPNIRNVKIRTGGDGSRCRAVASLGGTALRRNSRRQKPRTRAAGLGRSRAPRHGHKPQSARLPWRRVGRLKVSNPLAPRQLIFRTGSVEAMIRGNEPEK
jgi:hypothetical protein